MVQSSNGDNHFHVHIVAQLAALDAEAHEGDGAVGIFGGEEAIDFTLQHQIGAVVAEQRDAVGDPVFAQQMFGADQPIIENIEEAGGAHVGGRIQIFREGAHGAFVDLEEQAVFAAEVLEDGTFGDAECGGNVADAGGLVTVLGEVLHGSVDDAGALGFGPGTGRVLTHVTRRCDGIAGDSAHE